MKITDTHVYFWGGPFSNWYPSQITDPETDLIFTNTEQAFMWYKAKCFGDLDIQKKIETTTNPKDAKKLGRQVKGFDSKMWMEICMDYMIYVNELKFTQHEYLKKLLLDTEKRVIVEASPMDYIWGVGLSEDDPLILDKANWKGKNLLGESLMIVRNNISQWEVEL